MSSAKKESTKPTPPTTSETSGKDMVLLHSPTEDGEGIRAIRAKDDKVDLAELRPLKEGQDVSHSEVVRLTPHKELPALCDVDVMYSPNESESHQSTATDHAGPPRVASRAYRKNWDTIFTSAKPNKNLLN